MEKINFNRNWFFKEGKNVGDEEHIKDGYQLIGLPHSFGIPYYGEDDFYVGYGCYYKKFNVEFNKHDEVILEFGAVFQVCEVYVNHSYVLTHEGGYTMFKVDITSFIENGENEIFIRVNNLWNPTIAPRAGEHVFNGGIYRDVYLIKYPNSHIAWNGIKIYSKQIQENRYKVFIETEVVNSVGKFLKNIIVDEEGKRVGGTEKAISSNIIKQEIEVSRPILWEIDKPYLYTLQSTLGDEYVETEFGIRTIEWRSNDGFFLNDRHIQIEGVNVHQDRGGWCDASTHAGIERDISIIKDAGFNFIRGAHYPHHTEFAKECDRKGLLFWSEAPFWGIGAYTQDGFWTSSAMPIRPKDYEPFENNLKQQIKEMIDANYNSPSIICWSIGNEMFYTSPAVMPEMKELVQRLCDYVRELDPTRPAAIGGAQKEGLDKYCDVAGYNDDGAIICKNPGIPNMLTSYGSMSSYRPGKIDLYETKDSENYYSWRAGRAIWCGFHHGSITGIGNLGICDLYRLPLNAYYAYRNIYTGEEIPTQSIRDRVKKLELIADKSFIKGDGTDDVMITCAMVNERGERVFFEGEITFHIENGPLIFPTGKEMIFNSKLKNLFDGKCQIEARGYYSGKSVVYAEMNNIISNKIEVEVVADENYLNQDIIYEPLDKNSIRVKAMYSDICEYRPVYVSSEEVEGSSICLTSPSKKYWTPNKNDSQPYVLIDLQQYYERYQINIKTLPFTHLAMKIATSIDGRDWEDIGITDKTKVNINNRARYIKIRVNKKAKIRKIQIFER